MYYFAYGSNMSLAQMNNRCPESKLVGKAVLKNYRLDFLEFSPRWNGGCADIIPDEKSETWGLIYKVSGDDIKLLDQFEGHPNFYQRKALFATLDSGDKVKVEVYILVNKQPFIAPTGEYLGIIKSAAKDFEFPAQYQNYLDNIPTTQQGNY